MVALEFLVLSVIVRIGVEQHPLPPEFCFPRRTLFSKQCLYDTAFFCFELLPNHFFGATSPIENALEPDAHLHAATNGTKVDEISSKKVWGCSIGVRQNVVASYVLRIGKR